MQTKSRKSCSASAEDFNFNWSIVLIYLMQKLCWNFLKKTFEGYLFWEKFATSSGPDVNTKIQRVDFLSFLLTKSLHVFMVFWASVIPNGQNSVEVANTKKKICNKYLNCWWILLVKSWGKPLCWGKHSWIYSNLLPLTW